MPHPAPQCTQTQVSCGCWTTFGPCSIRLAWLTRMPRSSSWGWTMPGRRHSCTCSRMSACRSIFPRSIPVRHSCRERRALSTLFCPALGCHHYTQTCSRSLACTPLSLPPSLPLSVAGEVPASVRSPGRPARSSSRACHRSLRALSPRALTRLASLCVPAFFSPFSRASHSVGGACDREDQVPHL